MARIPSHINGPLSATFTISYFIFAVIITIYHLCTIYKHRGNINTIPFLKKHPSILLSYILLFIGIISGISLSMGVTSPFF